MAEKEIQDNLNKVKETLGKLKNTMHDIDMFFLAIGFVHHAIIQKEAVGVPKLGELLAGILTEANTYFTTVNSFAEQSAAAGMIDYLKRIGKNIIEVNKLFGPIISRIDEIQRTINLGDSRAKTEELFRNLRALEGYIDTKLREISAQMQQGQREAEEEAEQEHLKYEYEYNWYIFSDEKEKKRCDKDGVVPTETQCRKKKTVFIPGGRAKKDVVFIRPQLDEPPVLQARMAGGKFLGLAVKLLPVTGIESEVAVFGTSRRRWRWAFLDLQAGHAERIIGGRIVSKPMLERLEAAGMISRNTLTGKQIIEMMRGHISIGVKGAKVPFYFTDGRDEAPLGDINLDSDPKGFFAYRHPMETVLLVIHAQKEGRMSRHIEQPWGRGGNPPENPPEPPPAPIAAKEDITIVVALDVEPDFSDDFMKDFKEYSDALKEFKKKYIGDEGLNRDPKGRKEVFENIAKHGPTDTAKLHELYQKLNTMVNESPELRQVFNSQLSSVGAAGVYSVTRLVKKDLAKEIYARINEGGSQSYKFAFTEDGTVGYPGAMNIPRVDNVFKEYHQMAEKAFGLFSKAFEFFVDLNHRLKTV